MLDNAQWITSPEDLGFASFVVAKKFTAKKPVERATLEFTAGGLYTPKMNGKRVTDRIFAPGFLAFDKRVTVQKYDVTAFIREGANTLSVELGSGWAHSRMGWNKEWEPFPWKAPALCGIGCLTVVYADGETKVIPTDASWDVIGSPIRFSQIYHGETVDLTYPCEKLGKAKVIDFKTTLVPDVGTPVRECEIVHPREFIVTPKGEKVIDFGQNMTGYVRVRIRAKAGERVVLHHAEVLDRDGNFYDANMRSARNENVYVCDGKDDVFQPTYSFQGFRYIQLMEFPDVPVDLCNFEAVAVHTDMKRTGDFSCGNEKINQLYHNVIWGQLSNYLDLPTDCPQRDERLGWTGDAQVFCRTAAINYDVEEFFHKWLGDMMLDQGEDGSVSGVIPRSFEAKISAAWGDAATIIPSEIYMAFGNKDRLRECFPMMKKWVDYQHNAGREEFLWLDGNHYGDWLAMDGDEDLYIGQTPTDYIASAYFYHSAVLTVRAGKILGEDVSDYEELAKNVRSAFRARFMKDGMPYPIKDGTDSEPAMMTQTALVLALCYDLADEDEKPAIADKLVDMIRKRGNIMTTGFVGTGNILHALTENGHTDVAYDLLFQEGYPSWLYSVNHGATTMWEHWNGIKADGSFWSVNMNSFNHYAYGAVYDWIFGVAAGIKPTAPAYREISVAPHPDRRLGFLKASYESRYGKIASEWVYKDGFVNYEITVPDGVKATVTLPGGFSETVVGGKHFYSVKAD